MVNNKRKELIMNQSDQIDKLLSKLQKAQANFKELKKSGENKFFKTQDGGYHKFSTLNDIFDSCKTALKDENIILFYQCTFQDGMNFLETKIVDTDSGQWIRSQSALGTSNTNPQQIGSGITYFRRYHIQSLLNLEADFEDDGNQASNRNTNEVFAHKKKDAKIDFDFSGQPYRIFDSKGNKTSEFTDIRTWGMSIKKLDVATKIQMNNVREIERIKKDVNDDDTLTPKAKENLLESIKSIGDADESR